MTAREDGPGRADQGLLGDVVAVARSLARHPHPAVRARGAAIVDRCREPLRVAVAGQVKAGKSTLLNALIGDRVAATDAGECTQFITWYRNDHSPNVVADLACDQRAGDQRAGHQIEQRDGEQIDLRFVRRDGALQIDLGDIDPHLVRRLVVGVPSSHLDRLTLIDTPGIGSATEELERRTVHFVTPDDRPSEADAVIYLMRHAHDEDARFLEALADDELARTSPVHAIGVLSRADEIGSCRIDAMASAQRVALRYRSDPRLRRLLHTVLPVAGLLAETAATLTQDEYDALVRLSALSSTDFSSVTYSVDRFRDAAAEEAGGLSHDRRRALIDRLGIYGLRIAVALLRLDLDTTAADLVRELRSRSGIEALDRLLDDVFTERAAVLKARSALRSLASICDEFPDHTATLAADLERVEASAHEVTELELLTALRRDDLEVPAGWLVEACRLFGGEGARPAQRLAPQTDGAPEPAGGLERGWSGGLDSGADSSPESGVDDAALAARALHISSHWRRRATNPLTTGDAAVVAHAAVRSCELILNRLQPASADTTGVIQQP